MGISEQLDTRGYHVLRNVIDEQAVREMRGLVIENLSAMGNTRPNPASRHLAGFHRYPALEPLHAGLTANPGLDAALRAVYGAGNYITIGLSDITVNRSQPWHTDLLRGAYADYLTEDACWGAAGGGCLKALLYLQDGKSFKVVPGSHRVPLALSDDRFTVPTDAAEVSSVEVRLGDLVLMDIRLIHRGSTEDEMLKTSLTQDPKILVSTVFGARGAPLTRAMQVGNAHRMVDWDAAHLAAPGRV